MRYSTEDIEYHIGINRSHQKKIVDDKRNKVNIMKGETSKSTGPVKGYNYDNAMRLLSVCGFIKITINGEDLFVKESNLKRLP